jgi:protein-disulfide isomerase
MAAFGSSRLSRRSPLVFALVAALGSSACGLGLTHRGESAKPSDSASPTAGDPATAASAPSPLGPPRDLQNVEDSFAEPRQRDAFWRLASTMYAPCPDQAVTLVDCVEQARTCAECVPMAQLLADQVKAGNPASNAKAAALVRFGTDSVRDVPLAESPARGPEAAPVKIVVFSDFQCPACKAALPLLEELVEAHPTDVRLVHKFFPLPRHPRAKEAAFAAYAALKQGKYWEMERTIFAHQNELSDLDLERYAAEIGLDLAKFRIDRASAEARAFVERDLLHGEAAGVTGTPFILINGRVFESAYFDLKRDLGPWIATEIAVAKTKRPKAR